MGFLKILGIREDSSGFLRSLGNFLRIFNWRLAIFKDFFIIFGSFRDSLSAVWDF